MDGYAFNRKALADSAETTFKVAGMALAGTPFSAPVPPRQCVHVMTGAVMPQDCDTVIPQELVQQLDAERITVSAHSVNPGDNYRHKGEDIAQGAVALKKGLRLRPMELGILASLGMAEVAVKRKLRVAIFSTGDELRLLGTSLGQGQVYDSNRYTLYGMLTRLGCEVLDMGIITDEPDLLQAAFLRGCEAADVIITSGGVSVGAADFTKQIMQQLGDIAFWKIGMRPGRPMAFGKVHSGKKSALLFGLPGNPVAVMVTFYFLVREALMRLMGETPAPLPLVRARAAFAIAKKTGRTEYQRGIVSRADDGQLSVRLTGLQGSGILRSMSEANCIIVMPEEQGSVATGDEVELILFDGLV
jgi:molybdopterin molybdotransferase